MLDHRTPNCTDRPRTWHASQTHHYRTFPLTGTFGRSGFAAKSVVLKMKISYNSTFSINRPKMSLGIFENLMLKFPKNWHIFWNFSIFWNCMPRLPGRHHRYAEAPIIHAANRKTATARSQPKKFTSTTFRYKRLLYLNTQKIYSPREVAPTAPEN